MKKRITQKELMKIIESIGNRKANDLEKVTLTVEIELKKRKK